MWPAILPAPPAMEEHLPTALPAPQTTQDQLRASAHVHQDISYQAQSAVSALSHAQHALPQPQTVQHVGPTTQAQ